MTTKRIALVLAMFVATARVHADANHVPLDGSDPTFKPADFGYRIEATKSDGRASVRIFLNAAATKAFGDGRLRLQKGRTQILESVVGLQGRDKGVDDGVIAFSFDTRFVDDGELMLWSGRIDDQPFIRNFGGFRLSIKKLLEPASKKEIETPPPAKSGTLTPEEVKRINDQYRKAQQEQLHEQLGRMLTQLNGKLEGSEPYTRFVALTQLELPVAETIPVYIALLDNQNDYVKSGAMEQLAKFGSRSRDAGPKLLRIFQDNMAARWLRDNAALAMTRIDYYTPELIDEFIRLLEDPFPLDATRMNAIKALGQIGTPARKALPALHKLLADRSTAVQFEAFRAQGLVYADARPNVAELQQLREINWKDRRDYGFALLMGLQDAGGDAAFGVPLVLAILDKQPPKYLLTAAIETLGKIGGSNPRAMDAILKAFDPTEPVLTTLCERALASVDGNNRDCVAALGKGLLHPQVKVSQTAAVILAKLSRRAEPATAAAIEALKKADEKTDKESIGALVNLLGKIGPDAGAAVELLIGLLAEDARIYKNRRNEDVKVMRAFTLAMLTDIGAAKDSLPYIREHLGSRDPYSFAAGARAAGTLDSQAAQFVPLLIVALKRDFADHVLSFGTPYLTHAYVGTSARLEAIRALGTIGPLAREAIPLLEPLARPESNVKEVATDARAALKKIQMKQ